MHSNTGSAQDQAIIWGPRTQDWLNHFEPQFTGLWNAMLDLAEPLAEKKFLDAGCGAGGASLLAKQRGAKINGLDATPEFIEICKSRIPEGKFTVGDLEELPYPDNTFDVIIATNSLQFTYNPANALSEFKRVMKPDGVAIIAIFTAIERNDM
jgi:ubiquinone/menaquinone biosynthesis C-methylase UbiE